MVNYIFMGIINYSSSLNLSGLDYSELGNSELTKSKLTKSKLSNTLFIKHDLID